jgi:hypothetical protein
MRLPSFTCLLAATLLACASSGKVDLEGSGFLDDYTGFEHDPEVPDAWVWRARSTPLAGYDRLILDDVEFVYADRATRELNDEEEAEASRRIREIFRAAVEDAYSVVEAPGLGVVRVRMGVTSVVPVDLGKNPDARVADLVDGAVGGAAIEAELLDSVDGARLVAFIDRHEGGREMTAASLTRWGDAKEAFEYWAGLLRKALDRAHGR